MELETSKIISNYNMFFYATMCHVCKRFGDAVRLKQCGGCRMIAYCDRPHQKQHWTQHKSLCKAIRHVRKNYRLEDRGETLEEWVNLKLSLMSLVSFRLGRPLEAYEMEMFQYPRECAVCHEQNGQLEDCQNCIAVSFCKDHKDSIKHKDICASLNLCLRTYFFLNSTSKKSCNLDCLHYLKHVFDNDMFQDMNDFISTFGNIQNDAEVSYDVLAAVHSQYLTRPLTLFHAMRILDYVPKCEKLVVHVVAANNVEEFTLMMWEVLLHLMKAQLFLVVVMIGPELTFESNISLQTCDNCTLQKKKLTFEFHKVLYENYIRGSSFLKPDFVVGFNPGIHSQFPNGETWAPSILMLAKQDCPFILSCIRQVELELETDKINTILDRKIDYLYCGKNPFAHSAPFRALGPEGVTYQNQYLIVYRSLFT